MDHEGRQHLQSALRLLRAAPDPMDKLEELAVMAKRAIELTRKGKFQVAEMTVERIEALAVEILESEALRDMATAAKAPQEGDQPGWMHGSAEDESYAALSQKAANAFGKSAEERAKLREAASAAALREGKHEEARREGAAALKLRNKNLRSDKQAYAEYDKNVSHSGQKAPNDQNEKQNDAAVQQALLKKIRDERAARRQNPDQYKKEHGKCPPGYQDDDKHCRKE